MATIKNKIKIIICDDHQIFVEGLKALIKDSDQVTMIGEASNGEELLELAKLKDADVVLMDIFMPKINGIEATQKLKLIYPDIKILGLTMVEEAKQISDMIKAGASGYLLKTSGRDELVEAIVKVHAGERYLSNEVSIKLLDRMLNTNEALHEIPERNPPITKREHEIIQLIAQELTNEEIARKLNNSPMTIITHRKNLLRKLNVKNTAGLVRYAVQHGLVN
ncbi:MAG: response regulator transcription factor [Chitinophagales bacterium]